MENEREREKEIKRETKMKRTENVDDGEIVKKRLGD